MPAIVEWQAKEFACSSTDPRWAVPKVTTLPSRYVGRLAVSNPFGWLALTLEMSFEALDRAIPDNAYAIMYARQLERFAW